MPKVEMQVNGSTFRVIKSDFEVKRTHALSGIPTSGLKTGHVSVTIVADEKTYLWAENVNDFSCIDSITVIFYKKDEEAELYKMELKESYISKYKETTNFKDDQPATISMVFSCKSIVFNNIEIFRMDNNKFINSL